MGCVPHLLRTARASCTEQIMPSIIVTPGIRLYDDSVDDQSRVATPLQARQSEANFIVVGRPITQAKDPIVAMDQYLANWSSSSS